MKNQLSDYMSQLRQKKQFYYVLYALNFIIILIAWWITSGNAIPEVGFGYGLNRVGALLGLLGGSFFLVQFLLISRAKWLEGVFGHDRLTRMHRLNGLIGFFIIIFHPILIVVGNSIISNTSFFEQFRITSSRPYVGLAVFGLWLLAVIVISSLVIVRNKLKYEAWFYVHLLNYVFLSTVVWHQFSAGAELQSGQWLRWYWIGMYVFMLINLIYFRFIRPIQISKRNNLHVHKIERENDVTHIYIRGNIKDVDWKGGQFAYWRFLTKKHGKEQHPFSISVEPNNEYLRLSVKEVGDYTKTLSDLKKGTKLIMDGPHGVFTLSHGSREKSLFIAGGIGITPIRAMLGEGRAANNEVLLYSAKTENKLVFKNELKLIGSKSNIPLHFFVTEAESSHENQRITLEVIRKKVPDFSERDIYICGPPGMVQSLKKQLIDANVPREQIHFELFSLV